MTALWRDALRGIPPDSRIDTHTHTCYSDGTDTPAELIRRSIAAGLSGISITDHDTIKGYNEAIRLFLPSNFVIVPGVELTAYENGEEIHILGYGFDPNCPELVDYLAKFCLARIDRARKILENLSLEGVNLDFDDLVKKYEGIPVGRMHIAVELLNRGYCRSIFSAFGRWLSNGSEFVEPKYMLHVSEATALIHRAGGKAVLAHPGALPTRIQITPLISLGLDGIEARYPFHHPMQEKAYLRYAAKRGIPVTGGSDYHGIARRPVPPGARFTTAQELLQLMKE
ncbi:MAG: PHP domain-containing protein [Planctomycetota bacterium]